MHESLSRALIVEVCDRVSVPLAPVAKVCCQLEHRERVLAGYGRRARCTDLSQTRSAPLRARRFSVDVEFYDSVDRQSLRAEHLVGRDRGRSLIRKAAGVEFQG